MGVTVLVGLVIILGVVGLSIYFITTYNSLVRLRNENDRAWANIDVLLKQRNDELPKLMGTCRGYMQHEQQALQLITEARTALLKASTVAEKAQADNLVTGALRSLFAVAEKYPDLKANTSFKQLQGRLAALQENIAVQRRHFNGSVNTFNTRIARIPVNLVARILHLQPRAFFQAENSDREDTQLNRT